MPDDVDVPTQENHQSENAVWGSTIGGLMKIIEKNRHQLAFFQNRLKQAEFLDRPNMRLVGAASGHVVSLNDQITAMELELIELQRLEGGGLVLDLLEEDDLRWIWWWLNEPLVRTELGLEFPTFAGFRDQWCSWIADETVHPLAIRLATDDLIGFLLMADRKQTTGLDMLMLSPDYRYRGYGADAVRAALDVAFERSTSGTGPSSLFVVQIDIDRTVPVRCLEKAGLRTMIWDESQMTGQDDHTKTCIMGISREDWLRTDSEAANGTTVWTAGEAPVRRLADLDIRI
ncbi:MAG: GNAT family N-acetyltransferase [Candidatus Latescibacteria bacterium]|jgi:RimJ/RimL family protein N-acetyltransferase|nr:GNAT family N-acetyltransferase [Candidatus Latescibacterota bacterium]